MEAGESLLPDPDPVDVDVVVSVESPCSRSVRGEVPLDALDFESLPELSLLVSPLVASPLVGSCVSAERWRSRWRMVEDGTRALSFAPDWVPEPEWGSATSPLVPVPDARWLQPADGVVAGVLRAQPPDVPPPPERPWARAPAVSPPLALETTRKCAVGVWIRPGAGTAADEPEDPPPARASEAVGADAVATGRCA